MKSAALPLSVLCATMVGVTWHARRMNNSRADVGAMAAFTLVLAIAAAALMAFG